MMLFIFKFTFLFTAFLKGVQADEICTAVAGRSLLQMKSKDMQTTYVMDHMGEDGKLKDEPWQIVFSEQPGTANGKVYDDSPERTLNFPDWQFAVLGQSYEVKLEWPAGWVQFTVPAGYNIFSQVMDRNIPIQNVSKSSNFLPLLGETGFFCHACVLGSTKRWGDTCWAVLPATDHNRSCGCSSGRAKGEGIYYGGLKDQNVCHGRGGGFAGPKLGGQQRGNLPSIGLTFSVRLLATSTTTTTTTGEFAISCSFTVDNVVTSVAVGSQDMTSQTSGNLGDWTSSKVLSFRASTGTPLTICGYDWESTLQMSGGFAISCDDGISSATPGWTAWGASNQIDPLHSQGGGDGWVSPTSSQSGFYLTAAPNTAKIGVNSRNGCFRFSSWTTTTTTTTGEFAISCSFTMDNVVTSVAVGSQDMTSQTAGNLGDWTSSKVVSFRASTGTPLTICGYDWEGSLQRSGGFAISCNDGVSSATPGWTAWGTSNQVDALHSTGGGDGWGSPTSSQSGFYLSSDPNTAKIGVTSQYGCFKFSAWTAKPTVAVDCSFTIDNVVTSVAVGGQDMTSQTSGSLGDWTSSKVVSFSASSDTPLTICGYDWEGSLQISGGFAISCSDGTSSATPGWAAWGSSSQVDALHSRGGGDGWVSPTSSQSGFYLTAAPSTYKIGINARYGCFRFSAWR